MSWGELPISRLRDLAALAVAPPGPWQPLSQPPLALRIRGPLIHPPSPQSRPTDEFSNHFPSLQIRSVHLASSIRRPRWRRFGHEGLLDCSTVPEPASLPEYSILCTEYTVYCVLRRHSPMAQYLVVTGFSHWRSHLMLLKGIFVRDDLSLVI